MAERPHPPKSRCSFCAYSAARVVAIVLFVQVFRVVICLRCQYMVFNSRAFVSWFGVESRQEDSHDAGSRAFVFMHLVFH